MGSGQSTFERAQKILKKIRMILTNRKKMLIKKHKKNEIAKRGWKQTNDFCSSKSSSWNYSAAKCSEGIYLAQVAKIQIQQRHVLSLQKNKKADFWVVCFLFENCSWSWPNSKEEVRPLTKDEEQFFKRFSDLKNPPTEDEKSKIQLYRSMEWIRNKIHSEFVSS